MPLNAFNVSSIIIIKYDKNNTFKLQNYIVYFVSIGVKTLSRRAATLTSVYLRYHVCPVNVDLLRLPLKTKYK